MIPSSKWVPVLLLLLLGLALGIGWTRAKQEQAARIAYQDSTTALRTALRGVQARRDTLVDTVRVQRTRIVRDSGRADTVRVLFARDTTDIVAARAVIRTQDTVIVGLRGHVRTLTDLVAADSSAMRLFVSQRVLDSVRIVALGSKRSGWRLPLLGIRLPEVHCVVGPVASAYPKQTVGLGVACGLGF